MTYIENHLLVIFVLAHMFKCRPLGVVSCEHDSSVSEHDDFLFYRIFLVRHLLFDRLEQFL